MKKLKTFSRILILSALWITPTYAADPVAPKNKAEVLTVLNNIADWVARAFWIASAIAIFYAAFLYLTAGDSEEKVKKAHKQFLYAAIGIAVALFAYGLPQLVGNFLSPAP